ncbi:putative porin [uncultured Shewanella sp.]|uniref:putative porin n=1 Tax=uncultured Shewanella sp. TaxID=173975 RepID=UPI002636F481|nr:putative porin [uncultured Shewanella sp.]
MNKSTIAAALLLSLTSASAFAANDNNYHHEAQLEYNSTSENFSDGDWDMNYRYYTQSVDQKTVPYALSGFLAQSSNIGGHFGFNNDETDFRNYGIDGEYVFDSKWFINGKLNRADENSSDQMTYGIGGGYYFNDTSSVYANYQRLDVNHHGENTDVYTFGVKGYLPIPVTEGILLGTELNGKHYSTKGKTSTNDFNMYADWYITRAWSFGANYKIEDKSGSDDGYSINTAYFWRLTDSISARILVGKQFEPNQDGVFGKLAINGRF